MALPDTWGSDAGSIVLTTVTIANGASLSGILTQAVPGMHLVGIQMPAAWTAANMTFLANADGGATVYSVFDNNGTEVTIASPAANRYIAVAPTLLPRVTALQVRSGTSATPVNQGQTTVLTLLFSKYQ